jgi:hypothetical protein
MLNTNIFIVNTQVSSLFIPFYSGVPHCRLVKYPRSSSYQLRDATVLNILASSLEYMIARLKVGGS